MKTILLFLLLAVVVLLRAEEEVKEDSGFTPKFPTNLDEKKSFNKFVKLVETHKLNVSIIISKIDKWNNGNIQDIMALSITPFPNDAHLTSSKLDKQIAQEFVDLAAADHLTATVGFYSKKDALFLENNPNSDTLDENLRLITTLRSQDRVDSILDGSTDIAGHITMHLPDNSKTQVFFGNLQVEVIDSHNIEPSEIQKIAHYVNQTLFEYEDEAVPRVLVAWMDTKYPNENWQATDNADKGFLVDANKYAVFKTVIGTYGIFTS